MGPGEAIPVIVGIPRENKEGERRVALDPAAASLLVQAGHEVIVERGAGSQVGFGDAAYGAAGATVIPPLEAWSAELVVKVKEAQTRDLELMRPGITLFSFHHLPGEPDRARALAERGITAIAFEMLRDRRGEFPLLAPMSRIAGRMAVEVGAHTLRERCRAVLVLGGGHAGLAAAAEAQRRGMAVTVLTRSTQGVERAIAAGYTGETATPDAIERCVLQSDLVVGAVFVPAQPTPKLLPRSLVRRMRPGSMIVDVSIDAGGVAETSRPTTHAEPIYLEEGVLHYAVGNMPAAAPEEATRAISAAVLPYVSELASKGIGPALRDNPALAGAVLLWRGRMTHPDIAAEAGLPYTPLSTADLQ